MNHKDGGERPQVDLDWDDEGILPPVLSPDTEFVFQRMTEETLKAAEGEIDYRALDVGCGRALDAAALARKGGILFGCEPSRIMLRKAREGLAKKEERVCLVSSLAETLPFAGHSFHRVVCKGAIDHFLNPDRAVAEMSRVVSAGGKVVISVANYESLSCLLSRGLNRFVQRVWRREIPRLISGKFPGTTLLNSTIPRSCAWPINICEWNPSGEFPSCGDFPGGRAFSSGFLNQWP